MNNIPASALRGAIDFSTLGKPAVTQPQPNAPVAANQKLPVPSLVIDVTQATLASYLKISDEVLVLVVFTTVRHEDSPLLSEKMVTEVLSRNGEIVLLRIDGDQAPEMVKAFQLPSIPGVAALIKGQSVPMFAGDQEPAAIKDIVNRVLAAAKDNGITGLAVADSTIEPPKPALPPRHQAAYNFIEQGDYANAIAEFEAAILEAPADVLAATGLAQAKLLLRTDNLDIEQVLAADAKTITDVLVKADCLTVIGHFDMAFKALLDTFEVADKTDRELLRNHLLELFKVAPNGSTAVSAARARLTNLLF